MTDIPKGATQRRRASSLTQARQLDTQDWLNKAIVRRPDGDIELVTKGWWQRMLPGNNLQNCRNAVDQYAANSFLHTTFR